MYIKDLYKDRNANVKPFEDKVLATCEDIQIQKCLLQKSLIQKKYTYLVKNDIYPQKIIIRKV